MVMDSTGYRTKNDCADETSSNLPETETRNACAGEGLLHDSRVVRQKYGDGARGARNQ
jgi:hypothetical protein